jgi:hypothetical protein
MNHDCQLVDLIERANDARPYCPCGRPTEPVYRDGALWLDCRALHERPEGRVRRLFAVLTEGPHLHQWLADVEVREPASGLVGAA